MKKREVSQEKDEFNKLQSKSNRLETQVLELNCSVQSRDQLIEDLKAQCDTLQEKCEHHTKMGQDLLEKHVKLESEYENLKRSHQGLSEGYDRIFAAKNAMGEEIDQQRRALNAAVEDQNKQLKTVRRIAQAISTMDDMEQVRIISLLNANQSVCNIVRTLQHENDSIAYRLRVERLLGE